MGRHYNNTETSRQMIERLENENKELSELLLRADLQVKAAHDVIKSQSIELDDLRRDASGEAAIDSHLLDLLEDNPSAVLPVWEKKKPSPPSYYSVEGTKERATSLRQGLSIYQGTL